MGSKKDIKLDIHPMLRMLEDSFLFFIVSQNMMVMPLFQKILVQNHKGKMSEITTSVKLQGRGSLKFEVGYVLNRFNEFVQLKEENGGVECSIDKLLIQQGRLISIALFNIIENSKYNCKINKNRLFHFAKHLRNGASHGNKFNFEKPIKQVVRWRGKEIKQKLQGKQVFGEFIHVSDLYILMFDISKELYKIDKELRVKVKI